MKLKQVPKNIKKERNNEKKGDDFNISTITTTKKTDKIKQQQKL